MTIQVSNASSLPLTIWIEPWCDELALPPRSTLSLCAHGDESDASVPNIEVIDDRLVVWATAAGILIVTIDGIEQDTGSRTIALPPELFDLPVKTFVNTVFGGQPAARAAGAPLLAARSSWLLIRLLRSAKAVLPAATVTNRRRRPRPALSAWRWRYRL